MKEGTFIKPESSCILTINGGSSSIKFGVFEVGDPLRQVLHGEIDRIGQTHATLRVDGLLPSDHISRGLSATEHAAAVDALLDYIEGSVSSSALTAIGHRVVHGGPKYWAPQRITAGIIDELRGFSAFDPEHLPKEIHLIEAFGRRFPDVP
jgi:acetate kinase